MPRFEVRFSNGYWKMFDTYSYSTVHTYGLKKDAKDAVDNANLDFINSKK